MSLLFLLAVSPIAAVPPPLPQQGAQRGHSVHATDQLVCVDPELRDLDQKMITALAETTVPTGPFVEPQEDRFRRSRLCARMAEHRLCAIGAYRERIAVLYAIRSQSATTKTCVTGAAMAADTASGAMLLRADGRVIGWHRSAQKHGRSS